MTLWIRSLAVLAGLAAAPALAASGHHHGGATPAGEPGDPRKPSRVIEVIMDDRMYSPVTVDVVQGEQIRFVIRNAGGEAHEFLLATREANLKHAAVMKKHPDMEHDEPNGLRLAPKANGEILWRFTKTGTFEYACLIPGHREDGMIGLVTVKPAPSADHHAPKKESRK
ncbi:cupredoxin domain-containing protein [Bradyrhizobium sp. U87765 SZCCT0109]